MSDSNDLKDALGCISALADAIEKLAFSMPAPNAFTPQFVMLAVHAKRLAHDPMARQEVAEYHRSPQRLLDALGLDA